jgi:hypothetical protein
MCASTVYASQLVEVNTGIKCNVSNVRWESQKERDHCEDQDVGGWTILKWILER